jgi:uncharacterized protein YeaO (DUF488 family)
VAVRIVRLGTPKSAREGLRIGTVRFPPRGVRKADIAKRNFYDVWFPNLAPSPETFKTGRGVETDADWKRYVRRFRKEMAAPEASRTLDLLAALSHDADFSVGCYCEDESHCHRSLLREMLHARGAKIV